MLGSLIDRRIEALGRSLELSAARCRAILYPKSGCRSCVASCTLNALHLNPKERALDPSCDSCGACVSACPTGALDLRSGGAAVIDKAVDRHAGKSEVIFACERSGAQSQETIELPCAARLDEVALTRGPLRGAARTVVIVGDCGSCDRGARFHGVFDRTLEAARGILRACGLDPQRIETRETGTLMHPKKDQEASRRHFFRNLARSAAPRSPKEPFVSSKKVLGKRRRLVTAIRQGKHEVSANTDGGLKMGVISVSEDCFGCPVCEHVCASGAITRRETPEGRVVLRFDPALCDACGDCIKVCMPRAISLETPEKPGLQIPRILATLEPRECPSCRVTFHSASAEQCPRCQRGLFMGGNGQNSSVASPTRLT